MERLKSVVPETIKLKIADSTRDNLPSACSALLDFFIRLPLFHEIVGGLNDPETALYRKNKEAALKLKHKGNECYSRRQYPDALSLYSQSLRLAPTHASDMDRNMRATLYVNRSAVLHKMHFLLESLRDCNRALQISSSYVKGWYRRGKVNASLGKYEEAICDLNVAINMELSINGKRQIENEMKVILDQQKKTSCLLEKTSENHMDFLDEPHQLEVHCVFMPTKGRGLASLNDIPEASLVHTEEPFAAIILKQCRETHCHFCFNKLPVDTVPCPSCSGPLYCSQLCQIQAGGHNLENNSKRNSIDVNLTDDLKKHIEKIISCDVPNSFDVCIPEHRHECKGVHWPMVFPPDIVLIGRALVKYMEQQKHFGPVAGPKDLCHHYEGLSSEAKLELHIYSIVLLFCLQKPCSAELIVNAVTVSQCIILGSKIKVNSMAVVRIKSSDVDGPQNCPGKYSTGSALATSSLEQMRVGQALYLTGSLFNHSCMPNVHAYFISRTLHVRSTEIIVRESPLELSYGPQVGQWDCEERQQFLEDQYSFNCQCIGCSELNLSDLVLNGYRCIDPDCLGVVLDKCRTENLKNKVLSVDKLKSNDVNVVASRVLELGGLGGKFEPGYCLNCGSYRDIEASASSFNKAWPRVKRLEDAIASSKVSGGSLVTSLTSIDLLLSTLHAFNKKIAEVEDKLAQAFCLVGELQTAMNHCKASIRVLEKLYDSNHIVIGNELVKLASIHLLLGDTAAVHDVNRLVSIYRKYYGPQSDIVFPHLQLLRREAQAFV